MNKVLQGIVYGKTIELAQETGLSDGQPVEVVVRPMPAGKPWGEGIRRSAGALAGLDTEEDDRILDAIYQDRQRASSREIPA